MGTPLCSLAEKYGSDKCPSIHHSYTPFYYELLKDRKIFRILEIGIGCALSMPYAKNYASAASLRMWADFFPTAEVYGCDIHESAMVAGVDRVHTYICDQSSEGSLLSLVMATGGNFDLIVDDGSHDKNHQVFSAKVLMPFLAQGGLYVIEDVEFVSWVSENIGFEHYAKEFGRVGCGVPDNNVIVMEKQ